MIDMLWLEVMISVKIVIGTEADSVRLTLVTCVQKSLIHASWADP